MVAASQFSVFSKDCSKSHLNYQLLTNNPSPIISKQRVHHHFFHLNIFAYINKVCRNLFKNHTLQGGKVVLQLQMVLGVFFAALVGRSEGGGDLSRGDCFQGLMCMIDCLPKCGS